MLKKKAYLDPSMRLHDKNGRFIKKPKSLTIKDTSFLDLETPYFSQDEKRPTTYNRTGVEIEIERDIDGETYLAYSSLGVIIITVIYKLLSGTF